MVDGRGGDDGLDGGTGTDTLSLESAVTGTSIDLDTERSTGDGTDSLVSSSPPSARRSTTFS